MVDAINGVQNNKVDLVKWKKLTPQEIINKKNEGENIPNEVVAWAQDVVRYSKVPDDVTYEQVDGEVGIEALNQLGMESTEQVGNVEEDADAANDSENPEIAEEISEDDIPGDAIAQQSEEDSDENVTFSLGDAALTADNNEIRKRKERKGIRE